jgi:hypothetical protein
VTVKEAATVTLLNLTQSDQTSAIVSAGAIAFLGVMLSGCGNDGVVQMGGILPVVALMRATPTLAWTLRVHWDRGVRTLR